MLLTCWCERNLFHRCKLLLMGSALYYFLLAGSFCCWDLDVALQSSTWIVSKHHAKTFLEKIAGRSLDTHQLSSKSCEGPEVARRSLVLMCSEIKESCAIDFSLSSSSHRAFLRKATFFPLHIAVVYNALNLSKKPLLSGDMVASLCVGNT